jgi:hypothetical protein
VFALSLLVSAGVYYQHRTTSNVAGLIQNQARELPPPSRGLSYLDSAWNAESWHREGYLAMVSPIRPPSSEDGRIRIVVYLSLPVGGVLRAVQHGDQWGLQVPEGTRADRVELLGGGDRDAAVTAAWQVLDVRGIEFTASGEHMRVLRPKPGGALFGLGWPRGEQAAATDILGQLVLQSAVSAPTDPKERERAAAKLQGINDCVGCHVPFAPGRRQTSDPGIVSRGTDASGMFQVTSVLRDRLPFEKYRPKDMNEGDPFITRYCEARQVSSEAKVCPGGEVLEGALDVRAGLQAKDPHTEQVCATRLSLRERLDATGREVFRAAFAACEVRQ